MPKYYYKVEIPAIAIESEIDFSSYLDINDLIKLCLKDYEGKDPARIKVYDEDMYCIGMKTLHRRIE